MRNNDRVTPHHHAEPFLYGFEFAVNGPALEVILVTGCANALNCLGHKEQRAVTGVTALSLRNGVPDVQYFDLNA